jgi:hypothetical protein
MRLAAILVLVMLLPVFSMAKDTSLPKATQIFTLIYNQQFREAHQMLEEEKQAIGGLYYGILSIDLAWWRYISTRNPADLDVFLKLCNDCKGEDSGLLQDNIARFVGLNYLMRYEVKQGNFLRAGFLHLKVKAQLRQLDLKTATPEQTKFLKLYQYLFYYFEKKYIPFSANPESVSRIGALDLLHGFCSDSDIIVSSLSNYFLGKIYLEVEKQPGKATEYFRTLTQRFPSNLIFPELLRDSMAKN